MVMEFEYYLRKGSVRKTFPDKNRARSLVKMAIKRLELAKELKNPNFKLEMAYESIIECIEAIMSLHGYKSYSHEADIAFLRKIGFLEEDIIKVDNLRKLRHRSKYYGEEISENVSNTAIKIAENIIGKILRNVKLQ